MESIRPFTRPRSPSARRLSTEQQFENKAPLRTIYHRIRVSFERSYPPRPFNCPSPAKYHHTINCPPKRLGVVRQKPSKFIRPINNQPEMLPRDKTGRQTLTYHCTRSHGGFRRRLSRDSVPETSIYNFVHEQNGSERRGKFTSRFVPPLAQLLRTRKLVKYGAACSLT